MSNTKKRNGFSGALAAMLIAAGVLGAPEAFADEYASALANFKAAGASSQFFHTAYAYALFPDVGKGAFVVGGEAARIASTNTAISSAPASWAD